MQKAVRYWRTAACFHLAWLGRFRVVS